MSSVAKNILLNGINTVTSILFPVVTFPYIARVLLPEGVGTVNFLYGIISYIILLTNIGIPLYAIKEIARLQSDKIKRDTATVEIFLLNLSLCLLGYVVVYILVLCIPQISKNLTLFYILSISIIFNCLGINWFYQGTENFKFITVRAIIFRFLSAICLFIFVKGPQDLNIYGIILVGSTVGNNFINFIYAGKLIPVRDLNITKAGIIRHLRPALHVFILNLIISLYVQLNTIMLGFISNETEVGYFCGGTKLSNVAITVIGSISTVLLPRSSHLLEKGDIQKFNILIKKSLQLILGLSFPITLGLIVLAKPLIIVFCGEDFLPSVNILILNSPVVFLITVTTLTGLQILYPLGKVNLVIGCTLTGAITNLLLNFFFIPSYGALGAAISTLVTELLVFLLQIMLGKKYYPFKWIDVFPLDIIVASIVMTIPVFLILKCINGDVLQIIVGSIVGTFTYFCLLMFTRNPLLNEILSNLKSIKNKI